MWCIRLVDLPILNHPYLHPGMNPTQSWCMILFVYHRTQFVSILFRIFAFVFFRDISLEEGAGEERQRESVIPSPGKPSGPGLWF